MWGFALKGTTPVPAAGKITYIKPSSSGEAKIMTAGNYYDDRSKQEIVRKLAPFNLTLADEELDAPPDYIIEALEDTRFNSGAALDKFIDDLLEGKDPQTFETIIRGVKAQKFLLAKATGVAVDIPVEEQAKLSATAFSGLPIETVGDDGEDWRPGIKVSAGQTVGYGGKNYSCVQSHVTQGDWSPDAVPALWALMVPKAGETEIAEWTRPTGAHDAYNIGDRVLFEGLEYKSATDGNAFSPAEYPAGWSIE
jgi:hypothetical protein